MLTTHRLWQRCGVPFLLLIALLLGLSPLSIRPSEADDGPVQLDPQTATSGELRMSAPVKIYRDAPLNEGDDKKTFEYYSYWFCNGSYCDGGPIQEAIIAVTPPEDTVVFINTYSERASCGLSNPTTVLCTLPPIYGGERIYLYHTVEHTSGAQSFTIGWDNLDGSAGQYDIAIEAEDCVKVNVTEVCATDLSSDDGIYTGRANVTINKVVQVTGGYIEVNKSAKTITGDGQLVFVPNGGEPLQFYAGAFSMGAARTGDGLLKVLASAGDPLDELAGLLIDPQSTTDLTFAVRLLDGGKLDITGGKLMAEDPYPLKFKINRYTLKGDGKVSGSVAPFRLDVGPLLQLNIEEGKFTSEGLVTAGKLQIPHLTPKTLTFKGFIITKDDLTTSEAMAGAGADFSTQPIAFGPAQVVFGVGELQVGEFREGKGRELTIYFEDITLNLAKTLVADGRFALKVNGIRLFHDDATFEGVDGSAQITLPDIRIGGFKLTGVKVEAERRKKGYAFSGEGKLEVRNFIKYNKSDGVGIELSVKVYLTDDNELNLENLKAGLDGLSVPLGSTPVYLTSLSGEVFIPQENKEDGTELKGTVVTSIGPPSLKDAFGFTPLKGSASLRVNVKGWGELAGTLTLFDRFDAANAALSVNRPKVSEKGVRGSMGINVLSIFIGDATLYIGFGDPAVEGQANARVQIPLSQLPWWAKIIVGSEDISLARTRVFIGKFDGRYGFGANVQLDDLALSLYVDTSGDVDFSRGWDSSFGAPSPLAGAASPLVLNAVRGLPAAQPGDGLRGAGRLDGTTAATDQVTLGAGVESVLFALDATGYPYVVYSVTDPDGVVIDAATVTQYAGASLYRQGEGWAYLVSAPKAGTWNAVIDGLAGGETYQSDILVRNGLPSVSLTGVTPQANGEVLVNLSATDAEGSATVALYYDSAADGYAGVPIVAGLPLSTTQYVWNTSAVTTGKYYVYAKIDDGVTVPTFSGYSAPVTVGNTVAPAVPVGLSALADETSILLSWTPNAEPDLAGYDIAVTYSASPNASLTLTSYDSSVSISRPDLLQEVTLAVKAVDTSGNSSAFSSPLIVLPSQIDDLTPPPAPTNLVAVMNGANVDLTWQAADDAVGYRLYYGATETLTGDGVSAGASPIALGNVTNFSASGLPAGQPTLFAVAALDAAGNQSGLSNVVSLIVVSTTDSDGDGLPDDYELYHWGDLTSVSATDDSDGDGLNEAGELAAMTNPLAFDTDGDGASDGDEIVSATDPLSALSRPIVAVTTATLPGFTPGKPYEVALAAAGGASPYTWTTLSGTLPDGLTLSALGIISGTPTGKAPASFTVRVAEGGGQVDSARLTLVTALADNETELVKNGGFEVLRAGRPNNWTVAGFSPKDKVVKNVVGVPGKADRVVAWAGKAALLLVGGRRENSRAMQRIDAQGTNAGDSLLFSAQVAGRNLSKGAAVVLNIVYTDGSKARRALVVPKGTFSYTRLSKELELAKKPKSISVQVQFKNQAAKGQVYFDAISLTRVTPSAPPAGLSTSPTPLRR